MLRVYKEGRRDFFFFKGKKMFGFIFKVSSNVLKKKLFTDLIPMHNIKAEI